MSVFNVGLFKGPKYSSFDWSHGNRISMKAGKLNVIGWEFLNTGEKFSSDVSNVVRQAPMLAPTMDTYRMDVHAFAVRLRSIGKVSRNPWAYEDFFNVQTNVDGSSRLPSLPLGVCFAVNGFKNGTLFEQLGFPTFKKDREDYLNWLRANFPWIWDVVPMSNFFAADSSTAYIVPSTIPTVAPSSSEDYGSINPSDFGLGSGYSLNSGRYTSSAIVISSSLSVYRPFRGTLIDFILSKYPNLYSGFTFVPVTGGYIFTRWLGSPSVNVTDFEYVTSHSILDVLYERYKVDSISIVKEYEDWLLEGFLGLVYNGAPSGAPTASSFLELYGYDQASVFSFFRTILYDAFPDLPSVWVFASNYDRLIPAYPFEAYWKIISDWYINTAIQEPDSYYLAQVIDSSMQNYSYATSVIRDRLRITNELAYRFWSNDYFTSAFPSAQIGNAVGIPVNGTIIDLRNANAMQKLRERLLYAGSRIRDVWFAIWGKKTSAAILDMSEVIGSWSNEINVDNVPQTSQTENGSPQAGFSGVGLGYRSGGKNAEYIAEEPTVIMFIASISPRASYFQGLSKKFLRSNLYDYAIPQLANVGEQKIDLGELYLGSDSPSSGSPLLTFGFTRRNGDMMWTPDEVHGDFRDSLDYWHNARVFGSRPSLSVDFLQINPEADNLNRVFAVVSDSYDHFYCHFRFSGYVVRALPKHVHYDL